MDKHTEAEISDPHNNTFLVTKGAPQVILDLIENNEALALDLNAEIGRLAKRGYRALGVVPIRLECGNTWAYWPCLIHRVKTLPA